MYDDSDFTRKFSRPDPTPAVGTTAGVRPVSRAV